jgi:hypothetical protein
MELAVYDERVILRCTWDLWAITGFKGNPVVGQYRSVPFTTYRERTTEHRQRMTEHRQWTTEHRQRTTEHSEGLNEIRHRKRKNHLCFR